MYNKSFSVVEFSVCSRKQAVGVSKVRGFQNIVKWSIEFLARIGGILLMLYWVFADFEVKWSCGTFTTATPVPDCCVRGGVQCSNLAAVWSPSVTGPGGAESRVGSVPVHPPPPHHHHPCSIRTVLLWTSPEVTFQPYLICCLVLYFFCNNPPIV